MESNLIKLLVTCNILPINHTIIVYECKVLVISLDTVNLRHKESLSNQFKIMMNDT